MAPSISSKNGSLKSLTPKEQSVLNFIEKFILNKGFSPSYSEIQNHFDFASINSVQNYLKQLSSKGYLHIPGGNSKRAIQVLASASTIQKSIKTGSPQSSLLQANHEEILSVPLLGKVAAGRPLESFEHNEFLQVPPSLVKNHSKTFALKVVGQSMIEDGIFDGDVILVQEQKSANNGEIVVADINEAATVKRFFNRTKENGKIELRPSNSEMNTMWFHPQEVSIKGIVVGLIRKF